MPTYEMSLPTLRRQLTTAATVGCYVIAAAILLPVVCCLATEATKDADARENNARPTASQASLPSAIFENSSPNSYANRPSVPGLPTTPANPGSGSTTPENNSFRDIATGYSSSKAYADDNIDKTQSKVTNENNISRDSFTSRNDTTSSIDVIWTTASHAEVKQVATKIAEQLVHSAEDDGSNSRSRAKVTSGSETGSRTSNYFLSVLGVTSDVRKSTTTTDRYDDNDYNDDDEDDDDVINDENNGDSDAERRDDAYGYSDRGGDDNQTYEDYRGGVMDEEEEDGDGAGGGGGGGSDESRPEYLYVSDNFTTNGSQVDPENQDLQQDSNSDYSDDYNPSIDLQSRDQPVDHGQRFRAGDDYEAAGRDYHLGVEQHNFHLNLGEKISEMRSGVHRGQLISLRWLEHHPINHFAVFLWLVVALALVSILMLAYRFRHSVINAIQCTRVNYKQGKRFGVEEANDLLSNAQV